MGQHRIDGGSALGQLVNAEAAQGVDLTARVALDCAFVEGFEGVALSGEFLLLLRLCLLTTDCVGGGRGRRLYQVVEMLRRSGTTQTLEPAGLWTELWARYRRYKKGGVKQRLAHSV